MQMTLLLSDVTDVTLFPLADWELAKKFEELEEVRGANAQTHRYMGAGGPAKFHIAL